MREFKQFKALIVMCHKHNGRVISTFVKRYDHIWFFDEDVYYGPYSFIAMKGQKQFTAIGAE